MTNFPLYDMVQDARCAFVKNTGMEPTEVWLGPRLAGEFVASIQLDAEISIMSGRCTATLLDMMHTGFREIEGWEFMGLKIRLMSTDGVRVGVSCEAKPHGDG